MKAAEPMELKNHDTVRDPLTRLKRWIERNVFKMDVYELRGDEVVPGRSSSPLFKVQNVSSWQQVYICFGVPFIVIVLADGQTLELSDQYEDLRNILERVVPEKELPWTAI